MNPYVDSKRLWNDVYGSLEEKLTNAYRVIFVLCAVMVVSIAAMIFIATRTHIVPYVVTLRGDELLTVNELKSDSFHTVEPRLAMQLSQKFISNLRDISLDPTVNSEDRMATYAIATGSATALVKDFQEKKAEIHTLVKAEITAVLLKSENAVELRWKETQRDKSTGLIRSTKSYSAELIYQFSTVSRDPIVARHNPLGFYVTSCAWSEDLTTERG